MYTGEDDGTWYLIRKVVIQGSWISAKGHGVINLVAYEVAGLHRVSLSFFH
jgi:hypothetical protein